MVQFRVELWQFGSGPSPLLVEWSRRNGWVKRARNVVAVLSLLYGMHLLSVMENGSWWTESMERMLDGVVLERIDSNGCLIYGIASVSLDSAMRQVSDCNRLRNAQSHRLSSN